MNRAPPSSYSLSHAELDRLAGRTHFLVQEDATGGPERPRISEDNILSSQIQLPERACSPEGFYENHKDIDPSLAEDTRNVRLGHGLAPENQFPFNVPLDADEGRHHNFSNQPLHHDQRHDLTRNDGLYVGISGGTGYTTYVQHPHPQLLPRHQVLEPHFEPPQPMLDPGWHSFVEQLGF
jgi:hypothetical protein